MTQLCRLFGLLAIASLVFGVACFSLWTSLHERLSRTAAPADSTIDIVDLLGYFPLQIRPEPVPVALPVSRERLTLCATLVATSPANEREDAVRSRSIHASRLWQFVPSLPTWLERDDRNVITRVLIGAPAFSPSWRGLDIAERADGRLTEHRDQLLSTFAELGVPLDAKILIASERYTVRDLLRTSLNEFHLKQRDLEWTAAAYAHYLPPQSHWRNRLGEEYSFDDLASELMNRPLNAGACQGIHLLTSLTTMLLCDREMPFLAVDTRDRISLHLSRYVGEAVSTQEANGLWPLRWTPAGFFHNEGSFTPQPTLAKRMHVSGHLLEWFHWLPKKMKPPEATVRIGLRALAEQFEASPQESMVKEFCPYSHAITALFLAGSH